MCDRRDSATGMVAVTSIPACAWPWLHYLTGPGLTTERGESFSWAPPLDLWPSFSSSVHSQARFYYCWSIISSKRNTLSQPTLSTHRFQPPQQRRRRIPVITPPRCLQTKYTPSTQSTRHHGQQPLHAGRVRHLGRRLQPRGSSIRHQAHHLLGVHPLRLRHDLQHMRPHRPMEGALRPNPHWCRVGHGSVIVVNGLASGDGIPAHGRLKQPSGGDDGRRRGGAGKTGRSASWVNI